MLTALLRINARSSCHCLACHTHKAAVGGGGSPEPSEVGEAGSCRARTVLLCGMPTIALWLLGTPGSRSPVWGTA